MGTGTDFLEFLSGLTIMKYTGVEDFADKFNFLFTCVVLAVCTIVVTLKQYLLKPISCYMSTHVGGENLLNYVENYCWVQGTLPTSVNVPLPETEAQWEAMENKKILYYQWVPFVLGIQCIFFYVPRIVWQLVCQNKSGTDLQHLITSSKQADHADSEAARQRLVQHLARNLEQMLFQHRVIRNNARARIRNKCFNIFSFCVVSKRLGTQLFFSYILMKLFYLANAIGQVYFMQLFLGMGMKNSNYSFFGVQMVADMLQGKDWESTMVFPRVTFCYVRMKQMASTNPILAQCILPANMLNEKIYVFLWFWIMLAAILTAISIPVWFLRLAHQKSRTRFVKKFMKMAAIPMGSDKALINKFTRQFLRHDGVFLLKMISINSGDLISSEIVSELWRIFRAKYRNANFLESPEDDVEANAGLAIRLEGLFPPASKATTRPTAPTEDDIDMDDGDETNKLKRLMRRESLPLSNKI